MKLRADRQESDPALLFLVALENLPSGVAAYFSPSQVPYPTDV